MFAILGSTVIRCYLNSSFSFPMETCNRVLLTSLLLKKTGCLFILSFTLGNLWVENLAAETGIKPTVMAWSSLASAVLWIQALAKEFLHCSEQSGLFDSACMEMLNGNLCLNVLKVHTGLKDKIEFNF